VLLFPKGTESAGDVGEQQHPLELSQIARRNRDMPGARESPQSMVISSVSHLQPSLRVHPEAGESGTSACKQIVYQRRGKVEGKEGKGKCREI